MDSFTAKGLALLKHPLIVTIAPNIAFIIISAALGLNRPLINIDYLISASLLTSSLWPLGLASAIIITIIEIFNLISKVFPYIEISDLIYLIKFFPKISTSHQITALALLTLPALSISTSLIIKRHTSKLASIATLNFFLFIYLATILIKTDQEFNDPTHRTIQYIGSSTEFFLKRKNSDFLTAFKNKITSLTPASPGASKTFLDSNPGTNNNILLIVDESWGIYKNQKINDMIMEEINKLPNKKATLIKSGETYWSGATIAGELRELCSASSNSYNLKSVDTGFENCLPSQLNGKGYDTISIHGATGLMYERAFWYAKAGFKKSIFFETKKWPNRCYSFPGACDLDVLKEVTSLLKNKTKTFIYWLTLNTHSPYDLRDLKSENISCEEVGITSNTETCRNLKLQKQLFKALSESIENGSIKNTEIVIVGDHPPPIINHTEKLKNFRTDAVPFAHIKVH